MDERIKEGYHKIYAELFQITLVICALSVLIKVLYMGKNVTECIPEFPIMICAPLYQVIRCRMLGISQISSFSNKSTRNSYWILTAAILGFILLFHARGEAATLNFGILFVTGYLLLQITMIKLEKRRQKKLDNRYDD